jgi:YGGT family
MERRESEIERDPATGDVSSEHHRVVEDASVMQSESEVVSSFNPGWRAVQLVYLVFGLIDGLIIIRVVLKLLGANPRAAFAAWDYNFTDFFIAPFHNLLPTIGNEQSQLEMSAVVAILVYALIAWALARFVAIVFYRNVTVSRRGRGLRPRSY